MKRWYVTVEGEGSVGDLKNVVEVFVDSLEDSGLSVKRCAIDVTEQNVIVGFKPIEQYKPEVYEVDAQTGVVQNITAAVSRIDILQPETTAVKTKSEGILDYSSDASDTGHDFGGK